MLFLFKIIRKFWFVPFFIIGILFGVQQYYYPNFKLPSVYKKDKVELMPTEVLVKEIQQIGQLITSEYYGEVYGDLLEHYNQFSVSELQNPSDSLRRNFPYITAFQKRYFENPTTRKQMRNLVYIGRGWVKAGFDLSEISEKDLRKAGDSLFIKLPKAKILIHDINPWYIQEMNLKGFELFIERRKSRNFTDTEVKAVKNICKQKLIADAEKKEILQKATVSGEIVLQNFFSLLGYNYVEIETK